MTISRNVSITENIVAKNTPMKLTIAQKKSVIVFSRHIDLFGLTTPVQNRTNFLVRFFSSLTKENVSSIFLLDNWTHHAS